MKINKVLVLLSLMLIMPNLIYAQTENRNKNVEIQIQHGIEIGDGIPGYRIIVSNWEAVNYYP